MNAYNDVTETPILNGVVIPAFESANPGIKVIDQNVPYNGMLNKFIATAAAGDPPNLMRSDIAWVPQLASEGVLLETSKQPWFKTVKAQADPVRYPRMSTRATTRGFRTTPTPRCSSTTRPTSRQRI